MTIGEIMARETPEVPLDPGPEMPAIDGQSTDARCDRFPFSDNGADLSSFDFKKSVSQVSMDDRNRLIDDYRVVQNVMEQATMFAEPAVAVESSFEVVNAAQSAFGMRSRQFAEATEFHAELLAINSQHELARTYIAATVLIECKLVGTDSINLFRQLDSLATYTELTGDTLTTARLLNDLANRIQIKKGNEHRDTIAVRQRYALALKDLNRSDESEALLRSSYVSARRSFAPDEIGLINSINNYAYILGINGKLDKAIPLHTEVIEKNKAHFEAGHPRQIAGIGNLAVALIRTGRLKEAGSLITEQMRLVTTSTQVSDYELAVALLNRAELAVAELRFADARRDQQRAVEIYEKIYSEDHPVTRRALQNLWRTTLQLEDETALAIAEKAIAHAGRRRDALGFEANSALHHKRNLISESEVHSLYLDSLWVAGKRDADNIKNRAFPAIQYALQSPVSKAFGGATARRTAAARSPELGELVAQREALSLLWEIAELERIKLLSEDASKNARALTERRKLQKDLTDQMAVIDNRLKSDAPEFFELLRPQPLDATDAAKLLKPSEAVLLLQPGEFGTHVILVTAKGPYWHRSGWARDRINAAVQRLLYDSGSSIKVPDKILDRWDDEGRGYLSYDRNLAYAVYQELIAPFSEELQGISQIFTVAGGSLSSLPLAILVSEAPAEGDDASAAGLRQTRWMIDDFALATLPSLQSLAQSRTSRRARKKLDRKKFLGFGDPLLDGEGVSRSSSLGRRSRPDTRLRGIFKIDNKSRDGRAQVEKIRALSRLPGTASELKNLSAVLGGNEDALYLAERATEPRFRNAGLDAEIVVMATHGLVAGELDFLTEPALVMTPPEIASENDDGLLTASEITRLRIDADWVVLSACNTAASDGEAGAPGLSGLAQAFFYAGTQNLLVSHWPVRDDIAARITVRAIELEQAGEEQTRANALRRAIQELRGDTSLDRTDEHLAHPNAWAPFILVGDNR